MCLSRNGLDYDDLWERKRQAIEQVRGPSVWKRSESLSDIGGYERCCLDMSAFGAGPVV
jgi:hypothetical protein